MKLFDLFGFDIVGWNFLLILNKILNWVLSIFFPDVQNC